MKPCYTPTPVWTKQNNNDTAEERRDTGPKRTPLHADPAISLEDRIAETVAAAVNRAVEPLRVELERLRAERGPALLTIAEAAERVGRTVRTVERWAKAGQVEVVLVGTVRMVRLPPGSAER